ncbi:MAG TPA: nucleoside triphosphate pyrophosphohydrolase [Bacteroidales bacterium]|jgi:XTP/dITP diphosphohydrolase|nr:nucleoside triphosphate pyrophosphohydrolase [Bacteroidales bacterium]MDI9533309.1 nucleoside triphosphate pyrophosphohydrolase [Bacteroidota bacterium]MBP8709427.1 nucleoside triphosphate pyrophosphohydrolase [Bacteroidales bacterium]HNY58093.1 nucleoside triphosphate pyrophosphohydrolase [Bacteroidales bacterium]HOC47266.1 nucleoside triphosphate pyrophosphohydrolase [Bacteroidales bacterium]
MKEKAIREFARLLDIMDELRTKCPWDKKQTNQTLRKLTIEETYELADAILQDDNDGIRKELGDLMLHVTFYAKIGSEKELFDMGDVLEGINNKLVYRHPHVFGDVNVTRGAREVEENWEKLKMTEHTEYKPVLSGVPVSLPATIKANRIQEKVRGVGFDWNSREQIWDKVTEELDELKQAIASGRKVNIESELGDLFFSLINAARLYEIDPESALEKTNRRFMKRFNYLEQKTLAKNLSLHDLTLDEMNEIWEEAKQFDKPL